MVTSKAAKATVGSKTETRTIPAGEFKARCLQLMDELNEKNLTLIITKRGKPVMRATAPPAEPGPFVPLWGRSPNIKITGDIMAPLDWPDPVDKWNRVNAIKPQRKQKKTK